MHAAVTAAQQPQLALDPAPRGAQIEMPPALDATVVDLQRAGLTAHRADAPAAPQPDRHDHAQRSEADVDHRCPGQGEQPVQCRGDAHVALLVRPLSFEQPAACDAGRRRVTAVCATSEELLEPRTPCSRGYRYARLTHNSTGDPEVPGSLLRCRHLPRNFDGRRKERFCGRPLKKLNSPAAIRSTQNLRPRYGRAAALGGAVEANVLP